MGGSQGQGHGSLGIDPESTTAIQAPYGMRTNATLCVQGKRKENTHLGGKTYVLYVCSKRFQRQRLTCALLRNGGNGYLDAGLKSPNILSYLDFVTTLQHVRVRVEIALLDGVQINPLEMALFPELASTYQRAYPTFTIGNETKKERRRRRRSLKKKEYASLLTRNLAGYDWFFARKGAAE